MRTVCAVLVFVLATLTIVGSAAAARVALVIGNGAYQHGGALANPVRDAKAFVGFLKATGFAVTEVTDATRAQMGLALTDFSDALKPDDVAVFYYSGHGMQLDGENYLVGVEAELRNAFDVPGEAIELNRIVGLLEQRAHVAMLFIDACRNDPLAENLARTRALSGGLAPVQPQGEGTMIAFAAAPGQVAFDGIGSGSPFTNALIAHLAEPGLEVGTAFKRVIRDVRGATLNRQSPQLVSSLATEFYFGDEPAVPAGEGPSTRSAAAGPAPLFVPFPLPGADEPPALPEGGVEPSSPAAGPPPAPSAVIDQHRLAASAGDSTAMVQLGNAYAYGSGVPKDPATAVTWYRKAADAGSTDGTRLLAFAYLYGEGVKRDGAEAARRFRQAADAGDLQALTELGAMYLFGNGIDQDIPQGRRLVQQAVDAGAGRALFATGESYRRGVGVKQDFAAAADWFGKAIAAGDSYGHYGMCMLYDAGDGVGKNAGRAAEECYAALRGGAHGLPEALMRVTLGTGFIERLQKLLAADGLYSGAIDGKRGAMMKAALEAAFHSASE